MKQMKKHARALPVAVVCLLVLGSAAAFAQKRFMVLSTGRPVVKVLLAGEVVRESGRIPVEKAELVKSGEVLDWKITSLNEGNAPAHDYKAIGVVPPGTRFIAGSVSADGSATVSYSIDNGKTFSGQPMVEEKQADGSVKRVPAAASLYTQIRYEWKDPLNQGSAFHASYKVRLE